jgi:hypothetical protein
MVRSTSLPLKHDCQTCMSSHTNTLRKGAGKSITGTRHQVAQFGTQTRKILANPAAFHLSLFDLGSVRTFPRAWISGLRNRFVRILY